MDTTIQKIYKQKKKSPRLGFQVSQAQCISSVGLNSISKLGDEKEKPRGDI